MSKLLSKTLEDSTDPYLEFPVQLSLAFDNNVRDFASVGSRETCSPPPTDTDCDMLVLVDSLKEFVENCKTWGWEGGEVYADPDFKWPPTATNHFVSLRFEEVNLIVTSDDEFYDKFMLATHVCKTLNVMEKEHRKVVFQAILYGNKRGAL